MVISFITVLNLNVKILIRTKCFKTILCKLPVATLRSCVRHASFGGVGFSKSSHYIIARIFQNKIGCECVVFEEHSILSPSICSISKSRCILNLFSVFTICELWMMLSAYVSFRFLGRAVFASKAEMRLVDSHLVLHIVLVMGTNISAVDDGFRSGPLRRFARSYGGAYNTRNCGVGLSS